MSAANTIPQLSDRISQTLAELGAGDQVLRQLLQSTAFAVSMARSSEALVPTIGALGRFAVDEMDPKHSFSAYISEILRIYQAMVRAERRKAR